MPRPPIVIEYSEEDPGTSPGQGFALLGDAQSAWLVPLGLALAFWRIKSFLPRILIALAAIGWLGIRGYGWFMSSEYSRTYEPPAVPGRR